MSETINLHIGKRLRRRRRTLGLTQGEVATICGLSFQQIQKYESAANRMSAAMLWRLAGALGVGVEYFYDGLGGESSAAQASDAKGHARALALDPSANQIGAE